MLYNLHLYYSCRELAEEHLLSHVKTAQPNNHTPVVNGHYKDLFPVRVVHHGVEIIYYTHIYVHM